MVLWVLGCGAGRRGSIREEGRRKRRVWGVGYVKEEVQEEVKA